MAEYGGWGFTLSFSFIIPKRRKSASLELGIKSTRVTQLKYLPRGVLKPGRPFTPEPTGLTGIPLKVPSLGVTSALRMGLLKGSPKTGDASSLAATAPK